MSPRRPGARDPQEVLDRSPWLVEMPAIERPAIDTVDQLAELAGLFERGLLSRAAFEDQKRKVLGR